MKSHIIHDVLELVDLVLLFALDPVVVPFVHLAVVDAEFLGEHEHVLVAPLLRFFKLGL